MKLAIIQSNYIPWKGYFDIIAASDLFIILDDVQFTKNDWRNRNLIKTRNGSSWISIPVGKNIKRKMCDVKVDNNWQQKHWNLIEINYRSSAYFLDIAKWLKPLYLDFNFTHLSEVNKIFITHICEYLNINTNIKESKDFFLKNEKSNKLIDLCLQTKATTYLSGPAGKNYIDMDLFQQSGIAIEWMDYSGYQEYNQLWGEFDHNVSILDLLFNCGPNSINFLKYK